MQMAGNGWRLRMQARTRNTRMITRRQNRYTTYRTSHCQALRPLSFSCSVNQPIELLQCSILPQVVRGVWPLLRLWPYPTTLFPPPQPGHTPLACRGSRRPGGGRGGRLVRRGVVEREREAYLPIPCPAGPVDCPRVRCGLGEPAVVVGARSLRVGRPTDYRGGWLVLRGLVSLCLLCKI